MCWRKLSFKYSNLVISGLNSCEIVDKRALDWKAVSNYIPESFLIVILMKYDGSESLRDSFFCGELFDSDFYITFNKRKLLMAVFLSY